MSRETSHQSIEQILENSSITYFNTLHTDERLDQFFEQRPYTTDFTFSSYSNRSLLPHTLAVNETRAGKNITNFTANGSIEQLGQDQGSIFTLDLHAAKDSNDPEQGVRIVIDQDQTITAYDTKHEFAFQMNPNEFIDLSLRAADLPPVKVREFMRLLQSSRFEDELESFYPFWLELAETKQGSVTTTHLSDYCVEKTDQAETRVRIGRQEAEYPDRSEVDISIEHGLQRFDTSHEIVNRLDLSYVSTAYDTSHAERRIYESVEPPELRLTRARFYADNAEAVSVTELDALDPDVLQQFRIATEVAINSEQP